MPPSKVWPKSSICLGAWRGTQGTAPAQLLRDWGVGHVLINSPTGGGKTWNCFYPTLLLTWFKSAIVFDLKSEVHAKTAGARSHFSRILRFAPADPKSSRYNPLNSVRPGLYAIRDVQNIVELLPPEHGSRGDVIWDEVAKDYLAGLLLWLLAFAPDAEKCLAGAFSAMAKGKLQGMAMMANEHPDPVIRRFISEAARRLWCNPNERYIGSVEGTINSYLRPFSEPILAANTRISDFTASDLMCGDWPVTLYLCVDFDDMKRVRSLLRIMISQVLAELMASEDFGRDSREKRHRLLWALDEFPVFGRIADFANALTLMRSFGMRALLGVQTIEQVIDIYGSHTAIFNNCRFISTRQNWVQDCRLISDLIGEAPEKRESSSSSASPLGMPRGTGRSHSTAYRRVLQASEVGRQPKDRLMIFGEEKFIHAWRTPPGFWQRYVIPPPANTEHLPIENVWHGIRYTSPSPEDIAARIKAEAEAAAAKAAAEKEAEAKPRKKAASPRKQRRL
jgi:type IV secretion system protein VirD4